MSSGLAIAAVTAVLKNLVENSFAENAAVSSFGGVMVTALPLDRISVGTEERPQLNLFLYQVSQNRNADWLSRDRQEQFSRHFKDTCSEAAPLALDLHFVLTAFGTKDYQTDLLLGCVMQLFHQTPVLKSDTIGSSLKHAAEVNTAGIFAQALATTSTSALAEQLGEIKISPNFLSAEAMSKVWSLLQIPYRASVAYEVSMVCIDSPPSLCQTKPTISASQPRIEKITALDTNGRIVAGCTLVVCGKNLKGEVTQVRLNGDEKLLTPQVVEDTRLSIKLPPGLNAGVQQVQIVHQSIYQSQPHHDRFSNVAAFVLHPRIVAPVELSVSELSRTLTIEINPKVKSGQRVVLLLYSTENDSEQVYSFTVAPNHSDVSTIQIPILHVPSGTYYVQVQVDGAESLLDLEQAESDVSLQVTLP